ncbi:hypothetical protein [Parenemella sanctibonifatiensis]|uniref:Uncharacterized protein n=1 Tax=Parenemella sanctibonifatiensis TaxID=2016505 RepID=A0A255EMQ5_9ACTN|nr:hypothetical protein [Parenemella sanctibonifatiensis]OYN92490.1 hypothetical protein CGZ91_03120 [Parenemella sanctibonifatiensis]
MSGQYTYHCAPPEARWIQDRQAHLSVFHDRVGLVLSGSNTRLQPRWSTFTVGDPQLLQHRGEEEPDFTAPDGLEHLPTTASLSTDGWGVDLVYGEVPCQVRVELDGERALLAYRVDRETDAPVAAHAAFVAQVGKEWQAGEHHGVLGETPIRLTGAEHGGRFSHAGWRLELPEQAILEWPVRPHNPYAKDGAAPLNQARIVVSVPVGTSEPARITITVD